LHYLDVSLAYVFFSMYIYMQSSRTRERESTIPPSFSLTLYSFTLYISLSFHVWYMDSLYTCICVEQSTPLSLMYKLLINTSIFCTYRWYVTCTLALVGRSPASS
jgi:hypothetical protein